MTNMFNLMMLLNTFISKSKEENIGIIREIES